MGCAGRGPQLQALTVEFGDAPLQIGSGLFEHRAMAGVPAVLEFLIHSVQGQAEAFFPAEPIGCFPAQTGPSGAGRSAGVFLLSFDGLAFPAPGHASIITMSQVGFSTRREGCELSRGGNVPSWDRVCSENLTGEQK
jgi:hypothetical protein